jgi:hypothetical protein
LKLRVEKYGVKCPATTMKVYFERVLSSLAPLLIDSK